jgi:uncharacterized membrane protein YeaQ/YmgE (transglycosylase-associated protein family)
MSFFDLIESHSSSTGSILSKEVTYTKEIDYVLVRDEEGEARGVFRVPESAFYSVKMEKRKTFPRLGLKWKRFMCFLGSRKQMEPITESQFESYIVFGLPEFKTKRNIPVKNLAMISACCAGISGISVGNALCVWFDWYIAAPPAIFIVTLGWAICGSIIAINIYRGKWKK